MLKAILLFAAGALFIACVVVESTVIAVACGVLSMLTLIAEHVVEQYEEETRCNGSSTRRSP